MHLFRLTKEISELMLFHFPNLIFGLLCSDSAYRSIGAEKFRSRSGARAIGKASKARRLAQGVKAIGG